MDKRFDFYKDQYYFELNRKNDITNSLAIPIGFLTAVFSGYSYFFINLIYFENLYLISIFILVISISIFFAIKALNHLYKSLSGLKYGYVPEPNDLYNYEQEYLNYIKANKISLEVIDEKFFENLKKSLVKTTNKNRENNNFRSNRVLKANINTIYAIFFLFIAAIPFIISKNIYDNKNNILKQVTMATDDPKKNQISNDDSGNQIPQEPIFPVDQYIIESNVIDIPNKDIDPENLINLSD